MKAKYLCGFVVIFLCTGFYSTVARSQSTEESITFTTYYPAPYGVYRELRAQRMAIGPDYINNPQYCWGAACGTNVIPDAANLVVEGNVGIGTTSPGALLHLYSTASAGTTLRFGNSNVTTPFSGVFGANTFGHMAQSSTNHGGLGVEGFSNNTASVNAVIIEGYSGAATPTAAAVALRGWKTNGGTSYTAMTGTDPLIDFVPGNGTPVVRVLANGNVGIGTTNPGYTLEVNGSAYCNGGWSGSDLRWKQNIQTLPEDTLPKALKLRGVSFDWKRNEFKEHNFPKGRQIGIIAQEMEKEFPELVNTDNKGYKAIAYDKFTAVLLESIKAQQKEIESLKARVSYLEAKKK